MNRKVEIIEKTFLNYALEYVMEGITMPDISITLFQTPIIKSDGKTIHFPYKKAEALFYFMAIEKKATREYATELIWEDNDESLAKKNLRHALYSINKLFPEPVIVSPQKSTLIFSDSQNIHIDYDHFLSEENNVEGGGQLLEGFYIKNTAAFEEWLEQKQFETSKLYSSRIRGMLFQKHADRSVEETEQLADLCLKDDPLDERVYKYLMEFYRDNKLYHKAINLYQKLINILDEDLGLAPSKEISALYHDLLDLWIADSSDDASAQPDVKIRSSKLQYLQNAFTEFKHGKPEHIIVIGENGIGKTYLVNSFIDSADLSDTLLLQVTCFQAERKYLLQPWNTIFLKLEDYITAHDIEIPMNYLSAAESFFPMFGSPDDASPDTVMTFPYPNSISFRSCQNALLKIFQIVSRHTKILLSFDNINAMDTVSLELLSSLLRLNSENIMTILTSLDVMSYDLTTFVSSMVRAKLLTQLTLEPLTLEQTRFFISDSLPDLTLSDSETKKIYNISSGNIFFLVELINNMKSHHDINQLSLNAQGILNDRLNGVSPETRKLLDIISLFADRVPYSVLLALCNSSSQLLDNLEEAKELALVCEFKEKNEIYFSFHYHQMRDFIYNKIPPSKLRILHNRAALALEEQMKHSVYTQYSYKILAEHFTLGENHEKSLYYRLLYMEQLSGIYFELYPVVDESIISQENIELPEDINHEFGQLIQELALIKNDEDKDTYYEMEARLYHAKSRYHVLICDYEEALKCINQALHNPYTEKNPAFHTNLLKQLIYYCIQTCDMPGMEGYLKEGLMIARQEADLAEQAIYLRLYGYYHMMTRHYKQAIAALLQSIDLLEKSSLQPELYTVNIAAAYNYLGEINLRQGLLPEAHTYFDKAVSLCTEKGYTINATFYTNLGKVLFFEGNMEESQKTFVAAHQVYRHSTAIVGCATMHAFLAYFAAAKRDMNHASHHIRVCRRTIDRIHSPYEEGILYFILYKIAQMENLQAPFTDQPADYYKEECVCHIKPLNDDYLLSQLN